MPEPVARRGIGNPVLIEHLPQDRFPAAVLALTAFAVEAGVTWDAPAL
jgi:hypothetical protein